MSEDVLNSTTYTDAQVK